MSTPLTSKEILNVIDEFVNENGMYQEFKEFVLDKGYTLEEFGLTKD